MTASEGKLMVSSVAGGLAPTGQSTAHLTINLDRESDGRWIADIPELNLLLYGESREDAIAKAKDAAREIIADRIAHGEPDYPFSFHRSEEVGPAMLA